MGGRGRTAAAEHFPPKFFDRVRRRLTIAEEKLNSNPNPFPSSPRKMIFTFKNSSRIDAIHLFGGESVLFFHVSYTHGQQTPRL